MYSTILFMANIFFMCICFWVAFSPLFRPISWPMFVGNLAASLINAIAVFNYIFM